MISLLFRDLAFQRELRRSFLFDFWL